MAGLRWERSATSPAIAPCLPAFAPQGQNKATCLYPTHPTPGAGFYHSHKSGRQNQEQEPRSCQPFEGRFDLKGRISGPQEHPYGAVI